MMHTKISLAILLMIGIQSCTAQNHPSTPIAKTSKRASSTPPQPVTQSKDSVFKILFIQSSDHGITWKNISNPLPQDKQIARVHSNGKFMILGSEGGGLYKNTKPELNHWEDLNSDHTLPKGEVMGIFEGHSTLYVTLYQKGLYRKKAGMQWQQIPIAIKEHNVNSLVEIDNNTVIVSGEQGIFKSTDDCKTWKKVFDSTWVGSLSYANGMVLANNNQGIIRSIDLGEHWELSLKDEGGYYSFRQVKGAWAAIRTAGPPKQNANLNPWVPLAYDIPLRFSYDQGKSWKRMDGGLWPTSTIYDVMQVGNYVYCSHKNGISRSADGGRTWKKVYSYAPNNFSTVMSLLVVGERIYAILLFSGC